MTIKLSNKGNFDGDLYVKVQVKKSSIFGREGNNAVSEMQISVLDAILGVSKEITTIEGTKKTVQVPAGTQPNQKITLKG